MVDPITTGILAATVVPLAAGMAGEAGKQAWNSLATFVRDRFGRESPAAEAAQALADAPHEVVHGEVLGRLLEREAAADEESAVWLREWLQRAAPLAQPPAGNVTNTISGQARIHNAAIQAHTITGPITFDRPPSPPPSEGRNAVGP